MIVFSVALVLALTFVLVMAGCALAMLCMTLGAIVSWLEAKTDQVREHLRQIKQIEARCKAGCSTPAKHLSTPPKD